MQKTSCICESISELTSETFVTLVPHLKEYYLMSNTSFFINKLLPRSSQILIRGIKNEPLDLLPHLERFSDRKSLVLYPSEDAITLTTDWVKSNPGPYHLIVPDGTWSQARKLYKREKCLEDVTCVTLAPKNKSIYKLRKTEHEGYLCTLEATAYALSILEGERGTELGVELERKMIDFLKVFVRQTLKARNKLEDT
jgi:DTW domain-containing protein YfiP